MSNRSKSLLMYCHRGEPMRVGFGWAQISSAVVHRGFVLPLFVNVSELQECRLELGQFTKGGEALYNLSKSERTIRNNIIIIHTPFNNFNNSHLLKKTTQNTPRLLYLSKGEALQ